MDTIDHQKITRIFNQTGVPFQDWCFNIVNQLDNYKCVSEHPYTWPPSIGPSLGKPGAIDIIAAHFDNNPGPVAFKEGVIYLIIECKRANEKIKNWIFPSVRRDRDDPVFVSKIYYKRGAGPVEGNVCLENKLIFPDIGYDTSDKFECLNQGFEINNMLGSLNRDQNEIIYKSLLQSNTGLKSFTEKTADLSLPPHNKALFIPVVVTTADLYIAEYGPADVSIPSGEISPDDITYIKRPWVIYQFPLPDYLSYIDGKLIYSPTFVVNANGWEDFLKKVPTVYGIR